MISVLLANPKRLIPPSSTVLGAPALVVLGKLLHGVTGRHKYPVYWRSAPAG